MSSRTPSTDNKSEVPGWYIEFQADVIRSLPRPVGGTDRLRTAALMWHEDRDGLKKTLEVLYQTESANRFTLFQDLGVIVVPPDYQHKCLDSFIKANREQFSDVNDAITDANYSVRATTQLTPDRKISVKVYSHAPGVDSTTLIGRINFLRAQPGNVFLGAHGIPLIWNMRGEFPKGSMHCSFDELDALWKDSEGDPKVPYLLRDPRGGFDFRLCSSKNDFGLHFYLLSFCDVTDALA